MKKLLMIFFSLSTFLSINAMQRPTPAIIYEGPQSSLDNKEVEINARGEDDFAIGWIIYNFNKPQQAELTLFEVDEEIRDNQKCRVGQTLFQKFIIDALAHQCTKVTWTVNPVSSLDTTTLCTIYEKIVKKLDNSEAYELSKGDAYGPAFKKVDMTLLLKNKGRGNE